MANATARHLAFLQFPQGYSAIGKSAGKSRRYRHITMFKEGAALKRIIYVYQIEMIIALSMQAVSTSLPREYHHAYYCDCKDGPCHRKCTV